MSEEEKGINKPVNREGIFWDGFKLLGRIFNCFIALRVVKVQTKVNKMSLVIKI